MEDTCCICGKPATRDYDDREDCPSCGSLACEYRIQLGLDFMAEAGDR